MRRSIRNQLLVIVFSLVVLSFGVSALSNAYVVYQSFEAESRQENLILAEALAKNVHAYVINAYNIVDGLARNSDVRGMDAEQQKKIFVENAAKFPYFNNLHSTALSNGMQIARAYGPNASRRNRDWFKKIKEDGRPTLLSAYTLSGDVAVAAVLMPIIDRNGTYSAVMGADFKLDYIQDLVERFAQRPGSHAYVLDQEGVVLAHPDKMQFRERFNYLTRSKTVVLKDSEGKTILLAEGGEQKTENVSIMVPDELSAAVTRTLAGEKGVLEYRESDGRAVLAAYYPVDIPETSSRWAVIVVQDKAAALAAVYSVIQKNVLSAVAVLIVALAVSYLFLSRTVIRPIRQLRSGTEELIRGNWSKRLDIAYPNELGELAAAYNVMAENLEREKCERDAALVSLAASENKFSKAFMHYADVIGIIRIADRKIIEVNAAFYEIFGYAPEEVIGYTTREVGVIPSTPEQLQRIEDVYRGIAEGGSIRNLEAEWRTKDGVLRKGLWSGEQIEINGERCLIFAWKDISELKAAQTALQEINEQLECKVEMRTQELTALNEELRASNEELSDALAALHTAKEQLIHSEKMAALGALVAGVAHEINTPLGVGLTAASHLSDISNQLKSAYNDKRLTLRQLDEFVEDCSEAARITQMNLERAAKLVQSFKQVSADQSSESRRVFNVKTYMEEILLSMQPYFKKTRHRVNVECVEELNVDGFPGTFSQIITNLLMNSLLHGYEETDEGTITIRIYAAAENLSIEYTDDGKGMSEEIRTRIFEPFFTTRRGAGGVGLGLFIVYGIITEQLNGSIRCESESGRGTTFHIRFPARFAEPA